MFRVRNSRNRIVLDKNKRGFCRERIAICRIV